MVPLEKIPYQEIPDEAISRIPFLADQGVVLLQTFDDPTPTSADGFGWSVALDGDYLIIGAPGDDTNGQDVGQAYLFDASTGDLLQTFDDPTPTSADGFGWSVAIDSDQFGTGAVLIGVPGDDTYGDDSGEAHLFNATNGDLFGTSSDPLAKPYDYLGASVDIDGNFLLAGAPGDDTSGQDAGEAFLVDANTGDLIGSGSGETSYDYLGASVAVDGNLTLIGAPGNDTNGQDVGRAYLVDATTGDVLHAFDDPTPTSADAFGWSVAVDGNRAIVGAPGDDSNGQDVGQAYLFDTSTGDLLQTFNDPTPTSADGFGWSVAIDDNYVLIGAPGDDTNGQDVGQAYLFDATTGDLLHTFDDPTPTSADGFGYSVAIDGSSVLIGDPGDDTNGQDVGQAHLFDISGLLVA